MKKIFAVLLSLILVFAFAACSNQQSVPNTSSQTSENTPAPNNTNGKNLVVYFSMPETTDPNNMTTEEDNSVVVIDGEVLGNTQHMAYVIQETVGADIFRIEPETPYPTEHEKLIDLAKEEQNDNARPKIKDTIASFDTYENIFVGYPNWWGDMPMILYTFFNTYDLSGKTVALFCTSGGSAMGKTVEVLKSLRPTANWEKGKMRNRVSEQELEKWLDSIW